MLHCELFYCTFQKTSITKAYGNVNLNETFAMSNAFVMSNNTNLMTIAASSIMPTSSMVVTTTQVATEETSKTHKSKCILCAVMLSIFVLCTVILRNSLFKASVKSKFSSAIQLQ